MLLHHLNKYRDSGLLIMRIGLGSMFMYHGAPKIFGGPAKWSRLGSAMDYLGISFLHTFWGFMASFAEFCGGICLMLGLFFRPACILLAFTMFIAANMHLGKGDGFKRASHAIEACIVFFSFIFVGPGKFSLDEYFQRNKEPGTN